MKEIRLLREWREILDVMSESREKILRELSCFVDNFLKMETERSYKARFTQVFVGKRMKRIDNKGKIKEGVEKLRFSSSLSKRTLSIFYTYNDNESDIEMICRMVLEGDKGLYMCKDKKGDNKVYTFAIKDNNISHFKEIKNISKIPEISEKIKL